ncbi:MAG: HAMP domain-containing sensor histidine kinase, partial [Pseudomonadota bacterium]
GAETTSGSGPAAPMGRKLLISARRLFLWRSLSGRLLWLTAAFVLLAEVLIYAPSIANYRLTWLNERMDAAQIASLALEATPDQMVSEELTKELLANAEVEAVTLRRDNRRELILAMGDMPRAPLLVDMRKTNPLRRLRDGIGTFFMLDDTRLLVMGAPRLGAGEMIEIVVPVGPLKRDMLVHSKNIFILSIIISVITATLVYFALSAALVRPMRRLTESMVRFQNNPEREPPIKPEGAAADEVGRAELALAEMQTELRAALSQKARLAALGAAVSKINHDLRNILTSAQLASDRMTESEDPRVRTLAPRLVAALDRAIQLCRDTLHYGQSGEAAPDIGRVDLRRLVEEVSFGETEAFGQSVDLVNEVPEGFDMDADRAQLFRILLNLSRNAAQALSAQKDEEERGKIVITAEWAGAAAKVRVSDNGPGLPPRAIKHLFEPFKGSARPGGSGLGLAIARELAHGHGGQLTLESSSEDGATFLIELPNAHPGDKTDSAR